MSVIHESTVISDFDALPLSVMEVLPDQPPRALFQIAHGMCEHKERFLPLMRFLADRGIACIINDHRGHGKSVRSADDLGYFGNNGADGVVEDLHQLTLAFRRRFPDIPLFLFGHSMGSLAVRAYCSRFDRDIDGLMVCGSPGYNPAAGFGLMLISLLSLLPGGERRKTRAIYNLTLKPYARRFPGGPESAWLSRNAENVTAYDADPLCGFSFTLNGYRALMTLLQRAYDPAAKASHDIPVHFASGTDDPCAPDENGFNDAMNRFRARGYSRVTGKFYPNLRHEILNEKEGPQVMDDLRALLESWI